MDKIFNLEHVFDKDFGPFFRKFWGFGGFLGPVNKKEGKAFHCAQYIYLFFVVVLRNAMDPGFGRLFSPWSVDFYAYFLTK